MNKKALAPLVIGCSLVFVLAIFLYFSSNSDSKQLPGNSEFLGQEQLKVISTYAQGEEITKFLELSAILSAKGLAQDSFFTANFESNFVKYIDTCNKIYNTQLSIQDYSFIYSSTEIIAVAKNPVKIQEPAYTYEFYPSFRINV